MSRRSSREIKTPPIPVGGFSDDSDSDNGVDERSSRGSIVDKSDKGKNTITNDRIGKTVDPENGSAANISLPSSNTNQGRRPALYANVTQTCFDMLKPSKLNSTVTLSCTLRFKPDSPSWNPELAALAEEDCIRCAEINRDRPLGTKPIPCIVSGKLERCILCAKEKMDWKYCQRRLPKDLISQDEWPDRMKVTGDDIDSKNTSQAQTKPNLASNGQIRRISLENRKSNASMQQFSSLAQRRVQENQKRQREDEDKAVNGITESKASPLSAPPKEKKTNESHVNVARVRRTDMQPSTSKSNQSQIAKEWVRDTFPVDDRASGSAGSSSPRRRPEVPIRPLDIIAASNAHTPSPFRSPNINLDSQDVTREERGNMYQKNEQLLRRLERKNTKIDQLDEEVERLEKELEGKDVELNKLKHSINVNESKSDAKESKQKSDQWQKLVQRKNAEIEELRREVDGLKKMLKDQEEGESVSKRQRLDESTANSEELANLKAANEVLRKENQDLRKRDFSYTKALGEMKQDMIKMKNSFS